MSDDDRSYIGICTLLIIASLGGGAVHPVLGAFLMIVFLLGAVIYASMAAIADKIRNRHVRRRPF